jgi:hypothetical protein
MSRFPTAAAASFWTSTVPSRDSIMFDLFSKDLSHISVKHIDNDRRQWH